MNHLVFKLSQVFLLGCWANIYEAQVFAQSNGHLLTAQEIAKADPLVLIKKN